jgi:hypothetical protein
MENKMDDIFNNIEAGNLSDAKDDLSSIFATKVADAIDGMRKEIASKLTKEDLEESKMGKKLANAFTDTKKHKNTVKPPHKRLSDEEMETARDAFYKGHRGVSEAFIPYSERAKVVDTHGKERKSTMDADMSRHGIKVGDMLDRMMARAKANTEAAKKAHSAETVNKACEEVDEVVVEIDV